MEKLRDEWTRPPQSFIDQWNRMCGSDGRFNEETGYFEYCDYLDVPYIEANEILSRYVANLTARCYMNFRGRFNIASVEQNPSQNCQHAFHWGTKIETVYISGSGLYYSTGAKGLFDNCSSIKNFKGRIKASLANEILGGSEKFEIVYFAFNANSDLSNFSALKPISLKKGLEWVGTGPIAIIVHPIVYAKLLGDMTNTEVQKLPPEELAEWMEIPALAADKNVTFVTK